MIPTKISHDDVSLATRAFITSGRHIERLRPQTASRLQGQKRNTARTRAPKPIRSDEDNGIWKYMQLIKVNPFQEE